MGLNLYLLLVSPLLRTSFYSHIIHWGANCRLRSRSRDATWRAQAFILHQTIFSTAQLPTQVPLTYNSRLCRRCFAYLLPSHPAHLPIVGAHHLPCSRDIFLGDIGDVKNAPLKWIMAISLFAQKSAFLTDNNLLLSHDHESHIFRHPHEVAHLRTLENSSLCIPTVHRVAVQGMCEPRRIIQVQMNK